MLKLTYIGGKKVYTIEETNGIIYKLVLFHSFNGICGTVLVSSFVPPDMSYVGLREKMFLAQPRNESNSPDISLVVWLYSIFTLT